MNYKLNNIPERPVKPRQSGLTMVMDKGLSLRQVEDFIEIAGVHTDIVKLGWATSYVTPNLKEKLALYRSAGIPTYFGGTLFEAFAIRNQFDDYRRVLEEFGMEYAEISDGSISLAHSKKCEYIKKLSKQVTVITEVGSKEEGIIIHPNKWIEMIGKELQCGAWKVIAEARESGTVGIYRPSGKAHVVLINKIIAKISPDKIIWETPNKTGQTYFVKLLGANANLGNIAPNEVLALESLRIGLRSDTFFDFMK